MQSNKLPPQEVNPPKHQLIHIDPLKKQFEQIKKKVDTISTIISNSHL